MVKHVGVRVNLAIKKKKMHSICRETSEATNELVDIYLSDEKKFNFDGPDGVQSYWHDFRKKKRFSKLKLGVGVSLIVWAAFFSGGKLKIPVLEGQQNRHTYVYMLEFHLLN